MGISFSRASGVDTGGLSTPKLLALALSAGTRGEHPRGGATPSLIIYTDDQPLANAIAGVDGPHMGQSMSKYGENHVRQARTQWSTHFSGVAVCLLQRDHPLLFAVNTLAAGLMHNVVPGLDTTSSSSPLFLDGTHDTTITRYVTDYCTGKTAA